MKYSMKIILLSLLSIVLSINEGYAAQLNTSINSGGLNFSGSGSIRLLVAAPNDQVIEVSDESSVSWNAAGMPDGDYRYDVIVTDQDGSMDRDSGNFSVSGGAISVQPSSGEDGTSSLQSNSSLIGNLASSGLNLVLNAIVPQAHAQDLEASSSVPTVTFTDTDLGADNVWDIEARQGFTSDQMNIVDISEGSTMIRLDSGASADTELSIYVESDGDINLADDSIFIDRSAKRLGINQTVPVQGIHATATSGKADLFVRLENTAESTWDIGQDEFGDLVMEIPTNGNGGPTGTVFRVQDQTGRLVLPEGFGGQVRVNDEAGTAGSVQTLFNLINNGPPAFRFFDSNNGQTWQFRGAQNGSFFIDDPSTGVTEVEVRPGGTMRVGGALVQTSSRSKKHQFSDVDANEILSKVVSLDISAWSYRADPKESRHIGPVSEDFYAAFQLGDDSTGFSPIDTAGVTFASIQALHSRVIDQQEMIVDLEARIKELEGSNQRLSDLEATLASLINAEKLEAVTVAYSQ